MEKIYKYNSKYSKMTPEEIRKCKHENHLRWVANLSEEKKNYYKAVTLRCAKVKNAQFCEVCKKNYKNIYGHRNSVGHKNKASITNN